MTSLPVLGAANVCARCAARGPTCCEPEDGVSLAPLTPGDVARIRAATGRSEESFTTTRVLDEEERAALDEEEPVLRGLVGEDRVLRSLAKSGRACVFHAPGAGCTLSFHVRPLLCRRFPIVRDRGALRVRPGGDCLACDEAQDLPELLTSLGLDHDALRRIDRQIRADLRLLQR